jgi:hypothetical protein
MSPHAAPAGGAGERRTLPAIRVQKEEALAAIRLGTEGDDLTAVVDEHGFGEVVVVRCDQPVEVVLPFLYPDQGIWDVA